MEIYLIGWVEFVEHPGADYFSIVELLDRLFEVCFLVGIVIQGISWEKANYFKLFLPFLEFGYILETDFETLDEFFFGIVGLLLHSSLDLLLSTWGKYSI